MIDECGRYTAPGDTSNDAIRLTYLDTWIKDAFTVELRPQGAGGRAVWHRVGTAPPPPEPGSSVTDLPASSGHVGFYRQSSPTTRNLADGAWERASAAVSDPAFAKLAPGNDLGLDGFTLSIESCIGGRYHLVHRWTPGLEQDRAFFDAARTIHAAAGAVHALPEPSWTLEVEP
jgi:hypothetical protein